MAGNFGFGGRIGLSGLDLFGSFLGQCQKEHQKRKLRLDLLT
jgi:hypothetical protein